MLIDSYHPSQQTALAGKLSEEIFQEVFDRARDIIKAGGRFPPTGRNRLSYLKLL